MNDIPRHFPIAHNEGWSYTVTPNWYHTIFDEEGDEYCTLPIDMDPQHFPSVLANMRHMYNRGIQAGRCMMAEDIRRLLNTGL